VIAALAGLTAIALAAAMARGGTAVFFNALPHSIAALVRVAPLAFDHRVSLFALIVAGAATMVFALVPALQATRVSLTDALRGQFFRKHQRLGRPEFPRHQSGRGLAHAGRGGGDPGS
jgi:ABC-type antimicrobial peptide transport system permease subunit